jgi:hypothetical protein
MAEMSSVERVGRDFNARVARLDGISPSSDGRILAYWHRRGAPDTLSSTRSLQPFPKSDLSWMMITLLGLFIVIPNALTLLVLVMGVVLIQIQVRLEEQFLAKSHGDEYAQYERRVRRWF